MSNAKCYAVSTSESSNVELAATSLEQPRLSPPPLPRHTTRPVSHPQEYSSPFPTVVTSGYSLVPSISCEAPTYNIMSSKSDVFSHVEEASDSYVDGSASAQVTSQLFSSNIISECHRSISGTESYNLIRGNQDNRLVILSSAPTNENARRKSVHGNIPVSSLSTLDNAGSLVTYTQVDINNISVTTTATTSQQMLSIASDNLNRSELMANQIANVPQQFFLVDKNIAHKESDSSTNALPYTTSIIPDLTEQHANDNSVVLLNGCKMINGCDEPSTSDNCNKSQAVSTISTDGISYIIMPQEEETADVVMQVVADRPNTSDTIPSLQENIPTSFSKRRKRLTAKGRSYLRSHVGCQGTDDEELLPDIATDASTNDTTKKRCGLALETKVDMIKRISNGEKRADIADEYGVNKNTVKTIMKKSQLYLKYWNRGVVNPRIQRLKGAKREDFEDVLSYWYNSTKDINSMSMTGTVVCAKAIELAQKLGYTEFKASNGWLDRFKRRNGIVFNRPTSKKKNGTNTDKTNEGDSKSSLEREKSSVSSLQNALLYHDAVNVFTIIETGLFYKVLPSSPECLLKEKCAGGVRANDRLSILMCTNMTASEKFPILAVGSIPKKKFQLLVNEIAVQYAYDPDSWFTKDCIRAWLFDLDEWFVRHHRKVIIITSNFSINESCNYPQLNAITLFQIPSSSVLFQSNVITSFKLNYRQSLLTEYINSRRNSAATSLPSDTKLRVSFSLCIELMAKSWLAISESEIMTGFQEAGINKYTNWGMNVGECFASFRPEILEAYRAYEECPVGLTMSDYVHFDDQVQVCDEYSVDDMIARVLGDRAQSADDKPSSIEETRVDVDASLRAVRDCVDSLALPQLSNAMKDFEDLMECIQYIE